MLFASALAGLFLAASCQQENLEPVGKGNTVTYTVEAPGALQTKAIADGMNVNELVYEVWITSANGTTNLNGAQKLYQATAEMFHEDGKNKATITLDLVKDQHYTVLFWAQVAEADAYNTTELTAVSYAKDLDAYLANDESLAAFYAVDFVNDGVATNPTVLLKRPFAQVNLCTLNSKAAAQVAGDYNIALVNSKMTLESVPTTFNVATSDVDDEQTVEFVYNAVPGGEDKTITVNGENYYYAGMNYVFAGSNVTLTYDIQTSLNSSTNYATVNNTISDVPVRENYRTNIVGNLLTSTTDYEIIVDADFNANDYTVEDGASYLTISTAEELVKVAEEIAAGNEEYTSIMLGGDIDLAELALTRSAVTSNWTPVGTEEKPFTGMFDGNGYTIKNLALVETEAKEGKAFIGFFGYAKNATIKNVTFENVYINIPCLDIDHSQGHIGAVAGSLEGTCLIEDVTVKGDITVYATQTANGASRVAVVAGGNSYGNVTMKNVHVIANEGSSLIANNNTGALAGQLQGKIYFENCSSNINVTVNKFFAGGLIGIAPQDATFMNCHTTGDVAVVAGREGRHNDEYRVGGIAGGWTDGKNNVCTLINCSYTGTVSGTNADGSVAEPLDYMGYVGRGYTLSNCAGSKVVIDGVEFVQKYDNVYGVYTINGLTPVATADELVAALEANEGVIFMNDIKIEPASMSNAYGATGINVKNGQTIDGNGYTLNIKGAGGTWDSGINTTGGLIKNLTVTGSFRGIFINHTSTYSEKVVLENVTIGGNGTVYTISCDQGLYQGIEATNCTFNGWTSFAKTAGEAKFVNCSFGEGSGYKYCRPYSNTEFVGCTFCPGYAVDTTRATVTFTDCIWE